MSKEMENKSCSLEVKDLSESKGVVSFYFSTFDTPDNENDETTSTAFDKTFSESKARIKHFRNHEKKEVPGKIIELGKDSLGAYAISQLAINTIVGRDTFEQYKAGVITEHSFGFNAIRSDKKSSGGRILREVKLHEVSSLTAWGSNEHTPVLSIKSLTDATEYLVKLNKLLTEGNISDSLGEKFEAEYKALNENVKKMKDFMSRKKNSFGIDYGYLVENFKK